MPRTWQSTLLRPVALGLIIALFVFVAIQIVLPIVNGIPDYDSLEVVSGVLEAKKPCTTGHKSASVLPVVIGTPNGPKNIMIPCSQAIGALELGVALEVRARDNPSLLSSPQRPEVWSVSVGGAEVYRYAERVEIQKKIMLVDTLLVILLVIGGYLGSKRLTEQNREAP